MRRATKFRRSSPPNDLDRACLCRLLPTLQILWSDSLVSAAGRLSEFPSGSPSNDATSFFDDEFLIRRLRSQFVDLSARPANDNRVDSRCRAQAEMGARVARTLKAASGAHLCIAR